MEGSKGIGRQQEVRDVVQSRPAVPVSQQEALGEQYVFIKRSLSIASAVVTRCCAHCHKLQKRLQSKSSGIVLRRAQPKVVSEDAGKSESLWGIPR